MLEYFWNVFIVDALLGNFDRHNGNWGFLYQPLDKLSRIAPVFDCGSCLLPQADEKVIKKVLADEVEMDARIYRFPTSAIHLNGRKINYYDFLCSGVEKDCNLALKRMIERFNQEKIDSLIENTDYLSSLQMEFYKRYIASRYKKILCTACRQI